MHEYTIHGGDEGKQRLDILARTIAPGTDRFLHSAGLTSGMRCLDLGCGAGAVTLAIAQQVGARGHVTGLDIDARKIQLATQAAEDREIKNVVFKTLSAYDLADEAAYDLVYARFLLSHLRDPATVLGNVWRALRADGTVLLEDTDFSGHFSHPSSVYFRRYVALYRRLLKKRGADADFGPKMIGLLETMGFSDTAFHISQPAHRTGQGKRMAEITFEGISQALLHEELLSAEEAQRIHAGLVRLREQPGSILSLPRIFQVSGRKRVDP